MLEVQPVGVELGDAACCDDHAGRVTAKLDDVEGLKEGAAKCRGQAIVGRGDEREEVDVWLRLGAGDGAAGMVAAGRDGYGEERLGHDSFLFPFS